MFQLKIRNIPVLDDGAVVGKNRDRHVASVCCDKLISIRYVCVGIINIKDLTDSSFSLEDTGGKKGYMNNIIGMFVSSQPQAYLCLLNLI